MSPTEHRAPDLLVTSDADAAANARVLLEDADEDETMLIRHLLARAPILLEFAAVSSGREAMTVLDRIGPAGKPWAPDLILLDADRLGTDETMFLAALRQHPVFRALPVIALTGAEDIDTVRRAYDFGANAVIRKSTSVEDMSRIVNTVVEFWFKVARSYYVD